MGTVIEMSNVGKSYRLGTNIGGRISFKKTILEKVLGSKSTPTDNQILWALADIDLAVEEGECIGLLGRNGSGKSTLLKVINKVTAPTVGMSRTKGRVGSMLEVGAGFYGDLTGRENAFVLGVILGMEDEEIRNQLDSIFLFSELDDRMLDTPVKRYSSGQYMRLAFAVAAHLTTEILLVDEVLAVGDFAFQKKCQQKLRALATEGKTVVFVSHHLHLVEDLCDRVVWLENGRKIEEGETKYVLPKYRDSLNSLVENDQ